MMGGRFSGEGFHFSLKMSKASSSLSPYCCRITFSGSSCLIVKWWYCFIPTIFLKCGFKNVLQSYIGMTSVPSSQPASWATLCSEDASTEAARSSRLLTHVLLNFCFSRPNPQSGENLVCPTSMKDNVIFLCRPVRTRHIRYCVLSVT